MARTSLPLVAAIALLTALAVPARAEEVGGNPETTRTGVIGCAGHACIDVWKFQCGASKILHASVKDHVAGNTEILLTLVGGAPTGIKGKADSVRATTFDVFSPIAEIAAGSNTTIQGFAIISAPDVDTSYTVDLHCHKGNDTFVEPGTVTLIQNQ